MKNLLIILSLIFFVACSPEPEEVDYLIQYPSGQRIVVREYLPKIYNMDDTVFVRETSWVGDEDTGNYWSISTDYWKDTLIVISSDNLSMINTYKRGIILSYTVVRP